MEEQVAWTYSVTLTSMLKLKREIGEINQGADVTGGGGGTPRKKKRCHQMLVPSE